VNIRKIRLVLLLATGLTAASASAARAQAGATIDSEKFLNVSLGSQFTTHGFTSATSFPLYDETATISTSQTVGHGVVFDVSGGYRLTDRLFVALGLSTFHSAGDATVAASIPDPIFVNRHLATTAIASDMGQTTVAVNFQAVYMLPLTDRMDLSFFLGPSVLHVKQDFVSATVASGTQNLSISPSGESATTAKAGTLGFDLSYKVTGPFRAGIFVRYAGGKVDLPSRADLKVGGVQYGVGIRTRF